MSGNKSRLGKGLGALFPALPGEDALADASNNCLLYTSDAADE
mgnify:FL=1